MDFGSIVSNYVLEKLVGGLPRGMSKEDYWRSIRKTLKKKIDQMRNAKMTEIKNKFMGTYSANTRIYVDVTTRILTDHVSFWDS